MEPNQKYEIEENKLLYQSIDKGNNINFIDVLSFIFLPPVFLIFVWKSRISINIKFFRTILLILYLIFIFLITYSYIVFNKSKFELISERELKNCPEQEISDILLKWNFNNLHPETKTVWYINYNDSIFNETDTIYDFSENWWSIYGRIITAVKLPNKWKIKNVKRYCNLNILLNMDGLAICLDSLNYVTDRQLDVYSPEINKIQEVNNKIKKKWNTEIIDESDFDLKMEGSVWSEKYERDENIFYNNKKFLTYDSFFIWEPIIINKKHFLKWTKKDIINNLSVIFRGTEYSDISEEEKKMWFAIANDFDPNKLTNNDSYRIGCTSFILEFEIERTYAIFFKENKKKYLKTDIMYSM